MLIIPTSKVIADTVPSSGLFGYWKFDEGLGTTVSDSSGNGNTGTIGYAPHWVKGIIANALSFDGSQDYVSIPTSPSVAVQGNAISLECWIKPTVTLDGSLNRITSIIDKGDEYTFQVNPNDGRIWFAVILQGLNWQGVTTTTSHWQAGVWHQLTGTYDGSNLKIYVDGSLQNTKALSGNLNYPTSFPLTIGAHSLGYDNNFNGAIDEVKIYNYARSPTDIQNDYANPNAGLVGYWKFDEDSGNVAYDSSGNGNNGIIYDATWTTGKIDGALHFNGVDSWVEVPNNPTLTGFSQITLEAWVQEDSIPSRPNGIISKCDGWAPPTNAEYFLGTVDSGRLFFETDNGVAILGGQSSQLITQVGKWYHLAATWSGNSYAMYVNGQQVLTGSCTPQTTLSNSLPVQIGRHGDWSWTYFAGIIDEVKIYNCARTSEQIQVDAERGLASKLTTCDITGTQKNIFNSGETVYLKGVDFEKSESYAMDIVQHQTDWTDCEAVTPTVPSTATSVTTDISGNIAITSVYPNASPGQYDILIDINGNGRYDVGIDVLVNNAVTVGGGFLVLPEYTYGAFAALSACFIALVIFCSRKKISLPWNHKIHNFTNIGNNRTQIIQRKRRTVSRRMAKSSPLP